MSLGADVSAGLYRLKNATTITIASGVLVITQSRITVNGEGAVNDNLDTIEIDPTLILSSGYGEMLVLQAATGLTITIQDAQDNIRTNSGNNFAFTDIMLALLFPTAAGWICING